MFRVQKGDPEIPIVVLSGTDDDDLIKTALEKGAQDYLVKTSYDGALLARVMRYAVERHRLVRGLTEANHDLRTTTINYLNVINGVPDAVVLLDDQWIVLFANRAAYSLLGGNVTLGQLFGFCMDIGIETEAEIIHPERGPELMRVRETELEWDGKRAFLISFYDVIPDP